MTRILPLLIFLALAWPARAQDFQTPYNPKGNYHTWSIKGKVLPFLLGNGGGISGLLGIEYGFAKNQSIGIDGFIELQEDSDDNVYDTAGVKQDIGDYYFSKERAVFLNYRYYFNWKKLRDRGIVPYLLCFLRYGKLDQHYDPDYPLTSFLSNHEKHTSAGIMLGATSIIGANNRLGLDINTGLFDKQKVISTVYLKNGVETTTASKPVGLGYRLSVNLTYWFYFKTKNSPRT